MKDSRVYIDLIISACDKVATYIGDANFAQFEHDDKTQSAVIMQLHVIGEQAKKLDDETPAKIAVPWEKIIAQRNVISHEYFALELSSIWNTITTDVPALAIKLHEYLHSQGTEYIPPFGNPEPLL
jgi:uncharacterized protein with HEPN domain